MFKLFRYSFVFLISSLHCCLPQIVEYSDNFNFNEREFVPRVVNGVPAYLEDVPYQISFKRIKDRRKRIYSTFCGGALIGPSKVLTAAHCFEDDFNWFARFWGSKSISESALSKSFAVAGAISNYARYGEYGQWRDLESVRIPDTYKFPFDDIAVGFTTNTFTYNAMVASVLYERKFRDYVGRCIASGFGRTSPTTFSAILLKAELPLLTVSKCSRIHQRNMYKYICTSSFYSDVQKGDSGGPLVCAVDGIFGESQQIMLVGVVSGARSAGTFFTRVSSFTSFIEDRGSGCGVCYELLMCLCVLYKILLF